MAIKNIIFDFGGVLMDWSPEYLFSTMFEDKNELQYFLNNVCTLEWNNIFDKGKDLQEGVNELQVKYPKYTAEIQAYKDQWLEMIKGEIKQNTELLPKLKKDYKLFGLTNWSAQTFPLVYKDYDFFQLFDGIVVSGEEKCVKPDAHIFNLLMTRYNLVSEECLFIDDNLNNIEAAEKLHINCIHYQDNIDLGKTLNKILAK